MFLLLIDSLKIYTPYIHVCWGFFSQTNSYLQNKVWICERTVRYFAKLKFLISDVEEIAIEKKTSECCF